tara:strand:- start:41 stop:232 length:192 start_codon:yes stop_codon:yes gene_type:complete
LSSEELIPDNDSLLDVSRFLGELPLATDLDVGDSADGSSSGSFGPCSFDSLRVVRHNVDVKFV